VTRVTGSGGGLAGSLHDLGAAAYAALGYAQPEGNKED